MPAPPTAFPAQTILINEIAWSGTQASAYDEWIELLNTSSQAIQLSGWRLSDGGDINISLEGTISAHGFFLLERTDDATVSNIDADQIYAGGLNNNGENLRLRDPAGTLIDSANYPGGWPAGEAGGRISMERRGGEDLPGNWGSYSGTGGWGRDAAFNPIYGTPRQTNSFFLPTATPTPTASEYPTTESTPLAAGSVLINEIAWSGTAASSSDEWIELHNPGPEAIDLSGWTLSDGGDVHISLAGEIASFGFFLLERTDDNCVSDIAAQQIYSGNLNNSGERLFLYDAAGRTIDSANGDGGGWPAGDSASHRSMERRGGTDRFGNWGTFTGYYGRGRDAAGGPIGGTPGTTNSRAVQRWAARRRSGRVHARRHRRRWFKALHLARRPHTTRRLRRVLPLANAHRPERHRRRSASVVPWRPTAGFDFLLEGARLQPLLRPPAGWFWPSLLRPVADAR
ncbi:MAG: lamin tail domain-containing protein [Anaerolineales bacterium]